jgi:hypothetical protein
MKIYSIVILGVTRSATCLRNGYSSIAPLGAMVEYTRECECADCTRIQSLRVAAFVAANRGDAAGYRALKQRYNAVLARLGYSLDLKL